MNSFNSLMVRLKARFGRRLWQRNRKFQFLDGAIKSTAPVNITDVEKGFNSLMVRLKEMAVNGRIDPFLQFQFLDGAIKS